MKESEWRHLTYCEVCAKLYEQWRGQFFKTAYKAREILATNGHPYDHSETDIRQDSSEREVLGVQSELW